MAIRNPAHSGRLKSAILKGVYDENLKIESDLPSSRPQGLTRRRKRMMSVSLFFLFVTILANLYFDTWHLREDTAVPSSTASDQTIFPATGNFSVSSIFRFVPAKKIFF